MNIEKWEATREKGKKRFMWVNGFIGWGFSTALLQSLLMHIIHPLAYGWDRFFLSLVLFPIGGLLWAHFVWRTTEKKYLRVTFQGPDD